ncbi:methionyl-tRNA formyltransferase [Sulfurimonas sp.]|uniref:methionyl-tRNA formyltransferase n=1 Tax=Sulfurimonas sp. TaxID=2022749 RepID=UPI0026375C9D|nr:methionyl-tRNA formyltransferase [Sulfurimonas sp.]
MNVIFMGTPNYAEKILQKLFDAKAINVTAVYTQPDKPVGRKKIMTAPVVKTLAMKYNVPVYQPTRLRDEETVQKLKTIACDYIVVAAYGQILPKEILTYAPCINLHASILPHYRGASPIQQVLLNGDTKTGVTAMLMDEGLDTGAILKVKTIDVADDEMVEELFDALTDVATDLTIDVLENFSSLSPIKQDETQATHCKKITKADGEVSFDDAVELFNKYRAFTPWPGIYLSSGLKLKKIALQEREKEFDEAGKIIAIDKDSIVVTCKRGAIRIFRVQPNSKKEMDITSYINGKRVVLEDTLS